MLVLGATNAYLIGHPLWLVSSNWSQLMTSFVCCHKFLLALSPRSRECQGSWVPNGEKTWLSNPPYPSFPCVKAIPKIVYETLLSQLDAIRQVLFEFHHRLGENIKHKHESAYLPHPQKNSHRRLVTQALDRCR